VNIKLVLEYDGTGFNGWQQQSRGRTIQGELQGALERLTGAQLAVHGAGRTDAGAHATGQVASFHYDGRLKPERFRDGLNSLLPADVSVISSEVVPEDFHARYSARRRRYRYRWLDRPARPALDRDRVWHVRQALDVAQMAAAATALIGEHDWTTFCSASEPPGARTRRITSACVTRRGRLVELELLGDGFLRGQIRGIAGALTEVGLRRRQPSWLGEVLHARDRSLAARTAPARGLTLLEVLYEDPPAE
jgi:tRNA pseudouridine38-40 synthase